MINNPSAIGVNAAGEVYVLDAGNQKLKRIAADPMHAVTTLAGKADAGQGYADGKGTEARFRAQMGLAMGPDGEVYLADTANFRIRKVIPGTDAASTAVYTIAGSGKLGTTLGEGSVADLSMPAGLAMLPDGGSLLVSDAFNNVVRRVVR
jgi:DNA-binding beta-propeller fold protein YncE